MGLFDKFKTSTAIDRLSEEKLYEQVAQELKAGKKREGVWVKAMAKSSGDLNKAESLYIELRVQTLKDESEIKNNLERADLKERKLAATKGNCRQILNSKGYVLHHPMFEGFWVGVKKKEDLDIFVNLYETKDIDDLYDWAINAEDLT